VPLPSTHRPRRPGSLRRAGCRGDGYPIRTGT
jgi:hypothetical protein